MLAHNGVGARRLVLACLEASALSVLVATLVVHVTPHVRGLGFQLPLRLAVVAPLGSLLASATLIGYFTIGERWAWPRRVLWASLGGFALLSFLTLLALGHGELARAALPAVVAVATLLAWLVPARFQRPRAAWAGGGFGLLFALEVWGALAAWRTEQPVPKSRTGLAFDVPRASFDVEHRFLGLANGARIHYVDEGQGQTLLFLHGNPAWSFQWRDAIGKLRSSFRCVALDYPGFGLSSAGPGYGFSPREQSETLQAFVSALGLRDITLVMQDWGGPIGLGFATRRPELVRGLILGSTWAWPTSIAEPRGKFSLIAGGPLGEFVQMNFNGFAELGVKNGIVRELPRAELELYVRPFIALETRGIAAFYPGQINQARAYFEELERNLPRLASKPALIFWALRDAGFPRADLLRFQRAFPNQHTYELPNADHFFFEDESARMLPAIRSFVARN